MLMWRYRIGILFGVISIGAILFWLFSGFTNSSAEASAQAIVAECASQEDASKCYEDRVPALYPEYSLPQIFSVIREIRVLDHEYQFCHVVAHKLGEIAIAEDPEKWTDVVPLNPTDGLCSNGFIHGVIVGKFRDDVLDDTRLKAAIPEFAHACEPRPNWQPTPLDQAMCYHGLGHLYMFITNGDYRRSLDTCAATTQSPTGNFLRVCQEGVFMQTYQPLEPDDFALIELLPEKPSRENYRRICAAFTTDTEEGACLREAWPLFRTEIIEGGAAQFCSAQPNENEVSACFDSAFSIIGRQTLAHPEKSLKACSLAPADQQSKCISFVAGAILEENRSDAEKAISFCDKAGSLRASCISSLASRARFVFGEAKERSTFCQHIPSEWRSLCQ